MNYSELSDYEINNAVAVALGAKMVNAYSVKDVRESIQYDLNGTTLLVTRGFGDGPNRFDPCNSWADAGPIIEKYRISILFDAEEKSDDPCAWVNLSSIDNFHVIKYQRPKKALRSAMTVFLMMQGADHAEAA